MFVGLCRFSTSCSHTSYPGPTPSGAVLVEVATKTGALAAWIASPGSTPFFSGDACTFTRHRRGIASQMTPGRLAEPRVVVGFEVILGAYLPLSIAARSRQATPALTTKDW